MTTEVLIIGAGPTELMFANQLQRVGIDFILVDTKSEPLALHQTQQKLTFQAGDQLPQRKNSYYNHFKAPTLHLVCIGKEPLSEDKKAQLSQLFPFEINVVEEELSATWKQYGVQSDLFILVRPDHHVLFVGKTIAPHQITTIQEQLGYPTKQKSAVA